jgi:hypothetical protein
MARDFADKSAARQWVWDRLNAEGVARFPFPPHGRIPNFAGAEVAAARLLDIEPWESATAAIARELAGFVWAIARRVPRRRADRKKPMIASQGGAGEPSDMLLPDKAGGNDSPGTDRSVEQTIATGRSKFLTHSVGSPKTRRFTAIGGLRAIARRRGVRGRKARVAPFSRNPPSPLVFFRSGRAAKP